MANLCWIDKGKLRELDMVLGACNTLLVLTQLDDNEVKAVQTIAIKASQKREEILTLLDKEMKDAND
jgi:hypothetical protein